MGDLDSNVSLASSASSKTKVNNWKKEILCNKKKKILPISTTLFF